MSERRVRHRLVGAALAAALMPLNSTMIAVALPEISSDLGRDPAVVTHTLVTSYLVAAIVLQSPAGKLGDRVGHLRMVVVGRGLVAVGAVLGWLAVHLPLLTLARVLMAAGGAVLVPATVALLRQELPAQRRGRAFGAFGAVMALAAALGPLVGGELVAASGWPSLFAANLPVLAVSVVLGGLTGPESRRPGIAAPPRFDWTGSALLAAALASVVMGLRPDADRAALLLVVGGVLFFLFVLQERRAPDPVVAFSLFRSVPFSAGTGLIAVQNLVLYGLLFEIPLVAAVLLDLDARAAGRLLVSLMLALVVMSPVAGRLADRLGARPLALTGSVVALSGIAALVWTDLTTPGRLMVPLVLLGIGLGLATPAAQSASMTAVPAESAGMAAAAGAGIRYLGGAVGVAVLSLVLDGGGKRAELAADHRTIMVVFAVAILVGLLCAARLPTRSPTAILRRAGEGGAGRPTVRRS